MNDTAHLFRHGSRVGNLTSVVLLIATGSVLCAWFMIQVVEIGDPPNRANDDLETALLIWMLILGGSALVPQGLSMLTTDARRRQAHVVGGGMVIAILIVTAILVWFWSDEGDPRYGNLPIKTSLLTPGTPPVRAVMTATTSTRSRSLAPDKA